MYSESECILGEFADDTMWGRPHGGRKGCKIQMDLDRLERRAYEKLTKFNKVKCKAMVLGQDKHKYRLGRKWMGRSPEERTLGCSWMRRST